jgi:hypothetical protein
MIGFTAPTIRVCRPAWAAPAIGCGSTRLYDMLFGAETSARSETADLAERLRWADDGGYVPQ